MQSNTIETTTKQVTKKDQTDFPYKARKLFGLVTENETEDEEECKKKNLNN